MNRSLSSSGSGVGAVGV
ncbi:hypothetical protein A2U01_0104359, partial [Trifolium medium]|nr:hypothetical protein [Trifolium medium]